jgi:predicted ATPase
MTKDSTSLSKEGKEVLYKLVRPGERLATQAITPIIKSLISSKQGEDIVLKYPELYLRNRTITLLGQLIAETCADGYELHVVTQSDTLINALLVAVRMKIILPIQLRVTYISEDKEYNLKVDSSGRFNRYPDGFLDEWDIALECLLASPDEVLPYERLRKNPSLSTNYV